MKISKNEYSMKLNFLNKVYINSKINRIFINYDKSRRIRKVNRIKNEIKNGTYNIDSKKLSNKLEKYIRKKL
ncbi:flagellar biosynthesis anti-sigma factor FlgM [uncultured Clostridium sp.]|uniref:flagellar biosynthesis anti-sigma factor FlgM n=1 Tax=uncultured Clostridium sp. TaxID=59620 RepID=UPI00261744A2|nr:flagellar biosynthesis anti-sigma factor FlgM [uncultured Clostridium sp.]